jgi:integrase
MQAQPHWLAYTVLCLLVGVRPEEPQGIGWDNICLDRKILTIDAAASKVRARRIVPLEDNAVEWLKFAKAAGSRLPIPHWGKRLVNYKWRLILGYARWPQDCMRHTCASMLVAKYEDVGRIARWLGNSPAILTKHYVELVKKEDADRFWSIMP